MIKGKAIKFGDNVDTDQIIPAQYLSLLDIQKMSEYTFEYDKNFISHYSEGDILIGGKNFGCGSSREQAPIVLKEKGVKVIIAKDFARIFYRNSINLGLPLIKCGDVDGIDNLDKLEVNIEKGFIKNITKDKIHYIKPFPEFVNAILNSGGIINYRKNA